jgi:hypothetical protein
VPPSLTLGAELATQILNLVGHDPKAPPPPGGSAELFRRATRKQLLDCAQRLGLTGVSKANKDDLAERVQSAFQGLRAPAAATPAQAEAKPVGAKPVGSESVDAKPIGSNGAGASVPYPSKFDLGPDAQVEPMPENIPWGYGSDRATAMAVDPDRLYAYWEITEDAVRAARAGLGPAGAAAWLNVRVYDISGRLFDGTNAHSYFDHRVERNDRQWFFTIGKPSSSACVEVGLRSEEGYFVKIARSGRVEFPRREAAPGAPVEWLRVRTGGDPGTPAASTGTTGGAPAGSSPASFEGHAPGGPGGAPGGDPPAGGAGPAAWGDWTEVTGFPAAAGQRTLERRWHWQETGGAAWTGEATRSEWAGPVVRTEWESGPFTYPIEVPSTVEVRDLGEMSVRTEHGRMHIVYGPWQVVIRGLGARAERRVLGTWEYQRQIAIAGGAERTPAPGGTVAPGSSEWMMAGASERMWLGSSELAARGGSEMWMLGASELRLRGGSETMYSGASELRLRGASELSFAGASERLLRGASERLFAGASERSFAGASERQLGGASERVFAGGSERFSGGASERNQPPADGGQRPGDGASHQLDTAATPSLYPTPDRSGR